jgi:hypothetical protein
MSVACSVEVYIMNLIILFAVISIRAIGDRASALHLTISFSTMSMIIASVA